MARMNLRAWFGGHQPAPTFEDRLPGRTKKPFKRIKWKHPPPDDEDEDSHAIWKLAYADFMTAMMTFFLAMWLISAALKDNPTGLTSFFVPIRLGSQAPFSHGIQDVTRRGSGNAKVTQIVPSDPSQPGKPSKAATDAEEEAIFNNPFPLLTDLSTQAETAMKAAGNPAGLPGDGKTHDTFLDDYFLTPIRRWIAGAPWHENAPLGGTEATPPLNATAIATGDPNMPAPPAALQEVAPASPQPQKAANPKADLTPKEAERQKLIEHEKQAAQLDNELSNLTGSLPEPYRPNVEVKAISEGILICLTDGTNFNMFKIASAVPSPALVYFLEKLGNILAKYPGGIIVRGHTDGRPYAGDPHGNWRLSANRATMTYYMLIRGKAGDKRFLALEGFGERQLKNKADPLAGENRRIEILIRPPEQS
jgi:chemotaxis protein MotB